MLLNDIGKVPTTTLRKINEHLHANYGFKISESVQDQDLVAIMEHIREEITELKIKGEDAKTSPEISKRLLVLEGIRSLREFAMVQFQSPLLDKVVDNLVDFVVDTFHISGYQGQVDFDKAVEHAMDEYRSSRYRFPDDMIEQRVRQEAMNQLQSSQPNGGTPPFPMMEGDDGVEMDDNEGEDEVEESLNEKNWIHTDPSKRGMFKGKDSSDIADEKARLKAKDATHPGHVLPADKKKMHELEFAARAKSGGLEENNDPWASVGKRAQASGGHSITDLNPRQKELVGQKSEEPVPMVRDKSGRMVPDPFAAHAAERRKGIAR